MGLLSRKPFGNLSVIAIILGAGAGFFVWLLLADSKSDWFFGTLLSFCGPMLFLWVAGKFTKQKFNMISLRW